MVEVVMAKKRKAKRSKKRRKTVRHGKGHVPLKILEKRLVKLHRVVKSRGGKTV